MGFDHFIRMQNGRLSDSANRELVVLGKKLRNKELQFIRKNTDLYYSFWFFRSELTNTRYIDVDSLLSFFNLVFPDSLRQSMEGKEALKTMEARINTEKGMMAPDYTARDIFGEIVSSKTNSGKYVLLDFWASWCIPCIREMPLIH
jgi:thiol:disulfide interchange protein